MKLKPEYYISYDEDDVCIKRRSPDGQDEAVSSISFSAAMAWDGFERGVPREAIIDAIVNEFGGADRDTVSRDLAALEEQLIALGYAE